MSGRENVRLNVLSVDESISINLTITEMEESNRTRYEIKIDGSAIRDIIRELSKIVHEGKVSAMLADVTRDLARLSAAATAFRRSVMAVSAL